MRKFIGRAAATAALAAVAVVPLSGVASAQSQAAPSASHSTSASYPCWGYNCGWGWYGHDHGLLDLHLGLL